MSTGRGRPPKVERSLLIDAILNRKSDVLRSDKKPAAKNHPVWNEIANALHNKVTAATLYSFVADNKDDIKDKILGLDKKKSISPRSCDASANNSGWDQSYPSANSSMEPGLQTFKISISKKEYSDLICTTKHKRKNTSRDKVYTRERTVLKSGLWEEFISNALWEVQRIKCGFNYRSPCLTKDGFSGSFHATCKCGSILEILLLPGCENDQFISMECRFTPGSGKCGKRYLRQPIRDEVVKKLSTMSAAVYRADQARKMMKPGDPEPGALYKTSVLNKAKHETEMKKHCDPDTFVSLGIMKRESHKLSIHALGYDPFYLLYWTNHQIHMYRTYAKSDYPSISTDATGSVVRKMIIDKYQTKHIFLYQAVVNYKKGQFPVTQMLSERHDTVTIHMWLEKWLQAGVPTPREVISDSCKALLTAIVRTFSVHKTIEEYADASWKNIPSTCYVRLDVAHFIKMYANVLASVMPKVRVFYLSCIGQLIMARKIEMAADIVKAIFIVAYSENEGNDPDGSPTPCEIHKRRLLDWISGSEEWTKVEPDTKQSKKKSRKGVGEDDNDETSDDEENEEDAKEVDVARNPTLFNDNFTENSWSKWGNKLNEEAKSLSVIDGDRVNAHYMPKLANRLLKDIRWLPLWSCILRDRYGYGRVPASSAPSESDFNYVKTHLLQKRKPIRADEFVGLHIKNIDGRTLIADANTSDQSSFEDKSVDAVKEESTAVLGSSIETSDFSNSNEIVPEKAESFTSSADLTKQGSKITDDAVSINSSIAVN